MSNKSPFLERDPIRTDRALQLLEHGDTSLVGRMPYSSNATFLVNIEHDGLSAQGIYKPLAGESPLWDFPDGLHKREVAAFVTSEALGWGLVPATVERADLKHGIGSLQLFMPCLFEEHYFSLKEESDRYDSRFRRICAFDFVINNADRKAGHCLLSTDGEIWAIDHGVAFHHEFKLRTVIWDFAGDQLGEEISDDLRRFLERPPAELAQILNPFEVDAVRSRARALLESGCFPLDETGGKRYPWPLV